MPPLISDELRPLRFVAPSAKGGDTLRLRAFDGEERLSTPFEYQLELRSETMDVSLDFVGSIVAVQMAEINEQDAREGKRWFHGYITDFSFVGTKGDLAIYSATMRPWLWFLSQVVDYRVFQEMPVNEIIKQIFDKHGFSDFRFELAERHEQRNYCVQYGESDLAFVSRLMEEEGIYYYFEHSEEKHELIIADSASSHNAIPGESTIPYRTREEGFGEEHLDEWAVTKSVVSSAVTNRDYDFEKPSSSLEEKSKFQPKHENQDEHEVYVYPGGFTENNFGEKRATWLNEGYESQHERIYSRGNARHLGAGYLFTLEDYPREDQNDEYLIISVHHSIRSDEMMTDSMGDEEFYRCRIEAMPSDKPFRSPRVTPRPIVRGPETAVVVGPKGEEIWCDKYGRVKVQFHWDREGKIDQNSSCWVRVSQVWAGKNWGAIHTPRIGQEVVVSFLSGNPDQPLITGGVYNANNMPPYALPDNQTQSGIKSRSSKEGNPDNFNELRFEDKKGEEEVYFQSEKDLNTWVKNKETRKIGATRTTEIGNPDHEGTDKPGISVDAETLTVHASKKTEVKGNEVYEVATDAAASKGRDVTIKNGNEKLLVSKGDVTRKAELGKIEEEALKSIEFKVGQSSIKLEPAKITIKSLEIDIQADVGLKMKGGVQLNMEGGAMAELKSAMTTVKGDGVLILKGGATMIN